MLTITAVKLWISDIYSIIKSLVICPRQWMMRIYTPVRIFTPVTGMGFSLCVFPRFYGYDDTD